MSSFGQALAAINDKWDKAISEAHLHAGSLEAATRAHAAAIRAAHGNADAIKKANEEYARQTKHIRESQAALAAANAEREAEIALLRQQTLAEMERGLRDYENGAPQGNSPQDALRAIQAEASSAREAFVKTAIEMNLSADEIATGLSRVSAAELAREKALVKTVIGGLGLPMEATREKAQALGDAVSFLRSEAAKGVLSVDRLNDVLGQVGQQAQLELFGAAADLLDQMGRFDEADKARRAADELTFQLQRIQFNILLDNYEALGLIAGAFRDEMERLRGIVNNPANWPDFSKPAPQRNGNEKNAAVFAASYADAGSRASASDDASRRKAILDQITEWNKLGESSVTSQLHDLNATFVSMAADAVRLGVSLSDLQGAYGAAVKDFWDKALAPYETAGNVVDQLAAINKTFDDMVAAERQYGGDEARIQADRLKAVQAFWDQALQPIKDLKAQFGSGALGGVAPEQALQSAQQRFADLARKGVGGDAASIQALPTAITDLLNQQKAFSGTGPAYQALVATIQGVLDQILALGGAGAAPAAAAGAFQGLSPAPAQPGAAPAPPRPVPVPAGASGGPYAQIPLGTDERVDKLVGAIEDDVQGQKDDRASVQRLRAQVDRLLDVTREQSQQISDLVAATKRLTALAESNERRNAGGARRAA
jgi:hypothetical protein